MKAYLCEDGDDFMNSDGFSTLSAAHENASDISMCK